MVNTRTETVINQINTLRKMNVLQKQKKLIHMVQSIRFCGMQQMTLRSNRKSGQTGLDELENNDVNYRA